MTSISEPKSVKNDTHIDYNIQRSRAFIRVGSRKSEVCWIISLYFIIFSFDNKKYSILLTASACSDKSCNFRVEKNISKPKIRNL